MRIMAGIEAGGPEIPPDPHSPGPSAPPARDDPSAMARLTATFVTSHDGWVDDHVAFATDWGFQLFDIRVPVSIWYGSYTGGHIPPPAAHRDLLRWLGGRLGG